MSNMISVASGFQYSVNIGYDLNNDDKLKNFIPTRSALELLEDILLSTRSTSTDRARVLIGAYGKGKSHIVLTIMAMLMKRDLSLFKKTLPKIEENPKLYSCVKNYYDSDNKILPIIISGSNTSLTQAFLLALQRTLAENDLLDIMPDTNYKAALATIDRWKNEFPSTYHSFVDALDVPANKFAADLEDYNTAAYEQFERIYPTLTAGSVFNPFLGFDVVELYEGVVKSLRSKGYTGVYVIYVQDKIRQKYDLALSQLQNELDAVDTSINNANIKLQQLTFLQFLEKRAIKADLEALTAQRSTLNAKISDTQNEYRKQTIEEEHRFNEQLAKNGFSLNSV